MTPVTEPQKLVRIASLKSVGEFRAHVASLGLELPCEDAIVSGNESPLAQPMESVTINGKTIGNRIAVQPMEGWDGNTTGGVTEAVRRRWTRFGESGAKLICGGEAMAVCPEGRANPNQLLVIPENQRDLAALRQTLVEAHHRRYGRTDDLVVGFQLTHSGRFCRPTGMGQWEPRVAYRHPMLDRRFGVTRDEQIMTDEELERLVRSYVLAAQVAADAGADFVDIKHCHGYLLHEFLGAHTRSGRYGGTFENRTRLLREIVSGIRASGTRIDLAVRLSAFDTVPYHPDPARSLPGKLGPGIPEDYTHCLPCRYGFGVNVDNPVEPELMETFRFMELCADLGIKLVNLSAGSPYYNPHLQRPAAYPPSDGYSPPHDPLIDVARQINAVRKIRAKAASSLILVGSAYSYLQEYLPHVAQAVVRQGWADVVGIGRAVLSYPEVLSDAMRKGAMNPRLICRTFSDCTTAPRNGLPSGCYPLDKFYTATPAFQKLKEIKKNMGGQNV